MTKNQAETLVDRLKNAFSFHRFDEPGVYIEYVRALARCDYDRMEQAIDALIEEDSKNVPAISVLLKKYKETNKSTNAADIKNEEYCAVCDDKGFVLMTEVHKNGDKEIPYQFVLYCPFCAIGRSQAYDGRNISNREHRSPYYCPPLTQYFDEAQIEKMRKDNLERRQKKKQEVITVVEKEEIQSRLDKIGVQVRINAISDADDSAFYERRG